jgi:integrase/recombinase XerD
MFYYLHIYAKLPQRRRAAMSDGRQQRLFPDEDLPLDDTVPPPPLRGDASIQATMGLFQQHMQEKGFAYNTVKAFASDIRLLGKYLGIGQPVGEIGTQNLNDFLRWLRYERGVPCSNKSYARRVTTLKVFFGWLHEAGVLPVDPSEAVVQLSAKSPLPALPSGEQLEAALDVTRAIRRGDEDNKPDARPHLLLTLLLQTGVKKSEATAIVPNHIDRDHPDGPQLFIRYANPRLRNKERKLFLDAEWLELLDEYMDQYKPTDTLFTCTPRNLEYILSDVGETAGLAQGMLSFENLRWASALRDWQEEGEPDDLRQKLGLSKVTWRDTKGRLEKLAAAAKAGTA